MNIFKNLFLGSLSLITCVQVFAATPNAFVSTEAKFYPQLANQMSKNIALILAQRLNTNPEDFHVEFQTVKVSPTLDLEPKGTVQILGAASVQISKMDGLFSYPVLINQGNSSKEFQVTAVVKIIGPVVVAAKNLKRGDILSRKDLQVVKMPWRLVPQGNWSSEPSQLVGLGVKSYINAGSPVHADLVDQPMDIKSGDVVAITVKSGPGVMIRSRAIARQEGRKGDLIRLVQPDTKKLIQGQVTGPKTVEVQL